MAGKNDAKEYEIEKIISCRVATDGRISYLVRWKGYGQNDDTWEPESHLHGCKDAVLNFFKSRDVQPIRTKEYNILHIKEPSPLPSTVLKESPVTPRRKRLPTSSAKKRNDYNHSSEKERRRWNARMAKENFSDDKLMEKYTSLVRDASPCYKKLRLTPERRSRLMNEITSYRGRQLYRDKEIVKDGRNYSTERRMQGKSPKRCSKRRSVSEATKFAKGIIGESQTSKAAKQRPWGSRLFQMCLSTLLSLMFIFLFYLLLVYDLS